MIYVYRVLPVYGIIESQLFSRYNYPSTFLISLQPYFTLKLYNKTAASTLPTLSPRAGRDLLPHGLSPIVLLCIVEHLFVLAFATILLQFK
jgi:hypothetical protein